MSDLWNSFGNQSLNGVNYRAPEGYVDRAFDYILPDAQAFASGAVVLASGSSSQSLFQGFTDQGSIFVWMGLEIPAPAGPGSDYGYKAAIQILLDNEEAFADTLNNITGFGNGVTPFPIFPNRLIRPGTFLRILGVNFDTSDYYNFGVVLRGLKRSPAAPGRRVS